MGKVVVSAKTYDEAVTKALIELSTTSEHVEFNVLEKGSNGFLGIGAKPWIIEASTKQEQPKDIEEAVQKLVQEKEPVLEVLKVKEPVLVASEVMDGIQEPELPELVKVQEENDVEDYARTFLTELFDAMHLNVSYQMNYQPDLRALDIVMLSSDDMGGVIGKRGQTLDALQYLVSLVVNKHTKEYVRVKLDTENYRAKRREKLDSLARSIAIKVKRSGEEIALEPMNSYERRIIHSALQNHTDEDLLPLTLSPHGYDYSQCIAKSYPCGDKVRGSRSSSLCCDLSEEGPKNQKDKRKIM